MRNKLQNNVAIQSDLLAQTTLAHILFFCVVLNADASTYIGLGGGKSQSDLTSSGSTTNYTSSSSDVILGWKVNNIISFEAKYVDLGTMDLTTVNIAYSGAAASVVGNYPISDNFAIYGSVGMAYITSVATAALGYAISVSSTESKTAMTYGVGVQYNLFKNIAVRLSFDSFEAAALANNMTGSLGMYSGTLIYSFGEGSNNGKSGSISSGSGRRKNGSSQ
jgi:opacity protein-like surface antigen